jgi:hypothetical protein
MVQSIVPHDVIECPPLIVLKVIEVLSHADQSIIVGFITVVIAVDPDGLNRRCICVYVRCSHNQCSMNKNESRLSANPNNAILLTVVLNAV